MPSLSANEIDPRIGWTGSQRSDACRTGPWPARTGAAKTVRMDCGPDAISMVRRFCTLSEADVRAKIYFAAVCRCFPGKNAGGGDRVPAPDEILNCATWLDEEIQILRPLLVIPVGRLAIQQFIECRSLEAVIGRAFRVERAHHSFDLMPLPHPSGASPWPKIPPGKALLETAMRTIARHPAIKALPKR